MLLANWSPVMWSMIGINVPSCSTLLEKSPARSIAVGTVARCRRLGFLIRQSSRLRKKNILSFLMGPPRTPPIVSKRYGGFADPKRLLSNEFALSTSLRLNQYPEPWNSFVPDLEMMLTWAPGTRPYSAW